MTMYPRTPKRKRKPAPRNPIPPKPVPTTPRIPTTPPDEFPKRKPAPASQQDRANAAAQQDRANAAAAASKLWVSTPPVPTPAQLHKAASTRHL